MSSSRQSFERPVLGRPAGEEMARVLKTAPVRTAPAIDPLQATIDHWRHGALHDVVEPMSDHVVMTYFGTMQRLERRSGRSFAAGTAREGVVTIIPAGSSARWDIPGSVDVVQLYLPPLLFDQIAAQAARVRQRIYWSALHILTQSEQSFSPSQPNRSRAWLRSTLCFASNSHVFLQRIS